MCFHLMQDFLQPFPVVLLQSVNAAVYIGFPMAVGGKSGLDIQPTDFIQTGQIIFQ